MTEENRPDSDIADAGASMPWYHGVTRYQWLVLVIASLGWVFDVFEGQIFVASMNEAMPSLVSQDIKERGPEVVGEYVRFYNNVTFGSFLMGGALGGVIFGVVSDRIGRKRAMTYTILMYSAFTCLSAFSMAWWHMAAFRFLVAMGVGGEWAVASSMVAEVFAQHRSRAHMGGIFHASSVFGSLLAAAVGTFIIANPALHSEEYPSLIWRFGFLMGVLPALLIIWIRMSVRDPESWEKARSSAISDLTKRLGSFSELFMQGLRSRTLIGVSLAAVGLATFWGAHIYGKDLLKRDATARYVPGLVKSDPPDVREARLEPVFQAVADSVISANSTALEPAPAEVVARAIATVKQQYLERDYREITADDLSSADETEKLVAEKVLDRARVELNAVIKRWEMLGMILATIGGGLGLVSFGPICQSIGRRGAFVFFHIAGLVCALLAFQVLSGVTTLIIFLPIFGFFTLGMHAGYAIYFPELYPTRMRGTGAGFCFNVGRILAAPILYISGWMQLPRADGGLSLSLETSATILSLLFICGIILPLFAPETKGQDLPE